MRKSIQEFLSEETSTPIVYGAFLRKGANRTNKALQVSISFHQRGEVSDNNTANPVADILSITQGELPSARTETAVLSVKLEQFNKLFAPTMGIDPLTSEDFEAADQDTVWIYGGSANLDAPAILASEFFGPSVGISVVESPSKNPYSRSQTPVINPSTGQVVPVIDENGEILYDEFYRHTEISTAPVRQSIREYVESPNPMEFTPSLTFQIQRAAESTRSNIGVGYGAVEEDEI